MAYDGESRYEWKSVSQGPARYGGGFTAVAIDGGTELRYEGWATTTGDLARREAAWGRQAQREAEAELAAIKNAIEHRPDLRRSLRSDSGGRHERSVDRWRFERAGVSPAAPRRPNTTTSFPERGYLTAPKPARTHEESA